MRELENVLERAILLETTKVLQVSNLPDLLPVSASRRDPAAPAAAASLAETEWQAIVDALDRSPNVTEAARLLGINRVTLYRKLKKYGLPA